MHIARCLVIAVACIVGAQFAAGAQESIQVQDTQIRIAVGDTWQALAHAQFDAGPEEAAQQLRGMRVLLRVDPVRLAALQKLLSEQQLRGSISYHQWLTPQEFAERFGALKDDADRVVNWLRSAGMTDVCVARGRQVVSFNGTASAVEAAFHTRIHAFTVHGMRHYANVTMPTVPVALSGLIEMVTGLDDFNPIPQHTAFINTAGSGNVLAPDDLATIYDMKPLYALGITGKGISLAILGQTPLGLEDYRAYRKLFGLADNDFVSVAAPGAGSGTGAEEDQEEASLDLELAGAITPDAHLLYVWGASVIDAAQYVVDNDLAQVMSLSYAGCETGSALFYQTLAQQANAEGITWINAAGDTGAAGCDAMQSPTAQHGLAVTSPASVPEVTAVGGTALSDGSSSQYWSVGNRADGGTALSYIPEIAWSSTGMVLAGGGGISQLFTKPGYQSDFNTEEMRGRMLPDLAFAAAPGPVPHIYLFNGQTQLAGGTSAAAPAFAGIVALLNQYQLHAGVQEEPGLGNINPALYLLAEKVPEAFHDVTAGSNDVPCVWGSLNCEDGQIGFSALPGYDEATGLGSVDAYALAANWSQAIPASATIKLDVATPQSQAEDPVTLTAQVAISQGSVAHSPVRIMYTNPQTQTTAAVLGTVWTDGQGIAQLHTNLLPSGQNIITAIFAGSTTVSAGATSMPLTEVVIPFPTTVNLTPTRSIFHAGESAAFTVEVASPEGKFLGGPDLTDVHYGAGTVTLYAADGTLQSVAPVEADGAGLLTTGALVAGDKAFYANYSGSNYAASSHSSLITVRATSDSGLATTTALTASAQEVSFGLPVTLTAQVSQLDSTATPAGTVTFYRGSTALGVSSLTNGAATLAWVPPLGTSTLTAVYSGDEMFNGSASPQMTLLADNMVPGDFSLTGPISAHISSSSSTTLNVTLTPLNGFSGSIQLSCQGLLPGYRCTLPSNVTLQGTTQLSLTVIPEQSAELALLPLGLWTLPALLLRIRSKGAHAAFLLILVAMVGCGATAINPNQAQSTSTAPKGFMLSVQASSGNLSHQLQIAVTVQP